MNYLAHLYLSPNDDQIRIGCFIADSVKGSRLYSYPEKVQQGVRLHRAIDSFTDTNSIVKECVDKLRPKFRLYSWVVIDIYFDHFLAANWQKYSQESLSAFVQYHYALIQNNLSMLTPKIRRIFWFMKRNNWLENYNQLDFLERIFNGMSQRTSFPSNMENAVEELRINYAFYEEKFYDFFAVVCKEFNTKNEN